MFSDLIIHKIREKLSLVHIGWVTFSLLGNILFRSTKARWTPDTLRCILFLGDKKTHSEEVYKWVLAILKHLGNHETD